MRTEQGFTLIEVMVAMVLLSLALLEIGRMQLTALRTTSSANRLSQTINVAQDRVEKLLALPYDAPPLNDVTPVGQSTAYTDGTPPPGHTVRWAVDQDNPTIGIKTVHVQVTWRKFGRQKTLTLSLRKER